MLLGVLFSYMAQGIAASSPFQYSTISLIIILTVPTILCISINWNTTVLDIHASIIYVSDKIIVMKSAY